MTIDSSSWTQESRNHYDLRTESCLGDREGARPISRSIHQLLKGIPSGPPARSVVSWEQGPRCKLVGSLLDGHFPPPKSHLRRSGSIHSSLFLRSLCRSISRRPPRTTTVPPGMSPHHTQTAPTSVSLFIVVLWKGRRIACITIIFLGPTKSSPGKAYFQSI